MSPSPPHTAAKDESPESAPETGFAHTARRITGWTSNLLASAIVVVAALTLGRHFVSLDDEPLPQTVPQEASPWKEGASFLRLGDGRLALTRHTVQGDHDQALEACRDLCREAAERAGELPEKIDDYERRLLERVESMEQLEAGRSWAIHRIPRGSFPLLIATREAENAAPAGDQKVVSATRRMVAWTMAVPDPEKRWNIYVFRNTEQPVKASSGLDIPPPPQAERTVTLRAEDGSGQIGFRGGRSAGEVSEFYDRWLDQHQFERAGEWQVRRDVWQARYVQPGAHPIRVDIQFGPAASGELSGLITISPDTQAERTGS